MSRKAIRSAATSRVRNSVSASYARRGPVLFQPNAVAVGLTVLREKDQRRRIRRLERQDQGEQGEVRLARVELQRAVGKVFHANQIATKSVMPNRNVAVPIQRAKASLQRPKGLLENDGVGMNRRRNSEPRSRRSTSVDRRRGRGGRVSQRLTPPRCPQGGGAARVRPRAVLAPVLRRVWSRTSSTETAPGQASRRRPQGDEVVRRQLGYRLAGARRPPWPRCRCRCIDPTRLVRWLRSSRWMWTTPMNRPVGVSSGGRAREDYRRERGCRSCQRTAGYARSASPGRG